MRLTTKGRFAVTAMLDLAMRQGNGPVTLAGISERVGKVLKLSGVDVVLRCDPTLDAAIAAFSPTV